MPILLNIWSYLAIRCCIPSPPVPTVHICTVFLVFLFISGSSWRWVVLLQHEELINSTPGCLSIPYMYSSWCAAFLVSVYPTQLGSGCILRPSLGRRWWPEILVKIWMREEIKERRKEYRNPIHSAQADYRSPSGARSISPSFSLAHDLELSVLVRLLQKSKTNRR